MQAIFAIIQFLKEHSGLLVAVAALSTAYIAFLGLNSWKAQYKAKVSHKLARRLMSSFFQYRDNVRAIRAPFVSFTPASETEHPGKTKEQLEHIGYVAHYQRLNENLTDASREIYSNLLEAEALFGPEIRKESDELNRLKGDLIYLLTEEIEKHDPDIPHSRKSSLYKKFSEDEYYFFSGHSKDKLGREFDDRLKNIETILRRHLSL